MRRLLNSLVKGWKIRRIMNQCREVIQIKRDLAETEQVLRTNKGPKEQALKQFMLQRKKKIEELSKVIPNLYRNGRWIYS